LALEPQLIFLVLVETDLLEAVLYLQTSQHWAVAVVGIQPRLLVLLVLVAVQVVFITMQTLLVALLGLRDKAILVEMVRGLLSTVLTCLAVAAVQVLLDQRLYCIKVRVMVAQALFLL
jgi:hypothetical protein